MKNSINWFEIPVREMDRAVGLYTKMLGKPLQITSFGDVPHAVFPHEGDTAVSGTLVQDPKRKPSSGGVVIYLDAVDGVAACVARAKEAGAKVVQPVTGIGQHGFIALIEDLDGNVVGLHAMKE